MSRLAWTITRLRDHSLKFQADRGISKRLAASRVADEKFSCPLGSAIANFVFVLEAGSRGSRGGGSEEEDRVGGREKGTGRTIGRVEKKRVEKRGERGRERGAARKRSASERSAKRGVSSEASPLGGPSAPEKRVNIDPFFYLSHPQVFHPRYFFFPRLQGSPRCAAGTTETELVFL